MEQTKYQIIDKNTLKYHLSAKYNQYDMYNISLNNTIFASLCHGT